MQSIALHFLFSFFIGFIKTNVKVLMKNQAVFFLGFLMLSAVLMISAVLLGEMPYTNENMETALVGEDKPVVVVDAGHGGEDGGCTSSDGVCEKELNLIVAKKVRDILTSSGYKVIMTREEDVMLYDMYGDLDDYRGKKKIFDLKNRIKLANNSDAEIFLSIHMNKFPREQYSGLQVYYSDNNDASSKLAENIRATTVSFLQPNNNRQIKSSGSSIFVLDRLEMPAVLVECGFLSNPDETKLLCESAYQDKLALVIATSIMTFRES